MPAKAPPAVEEGTLLQRVRKLLNECDKTNLEIFALTGLNPGWLQTVRNGRIRDPGVNRVQKLYEFLTNRQLKV